MMAKKKRMTVREKKDRAEWKKQMQEGRLPPAGQAKTQPEEIYR